METRREGFLYMVSTGGKITANTQKKLLGIEIYIPDDKELFNLFFNKKLEIESELGFQMDWMPIPDGKASGIIITCARDIKNENQWEEYFKWFAEKANKMKMVFNKYR